LCPHIGTLLIFFKTPACTMKSFHVLLFSICFVILGRAAEETDEPEAGGLPLADVTNEALRNNPSIKAALLRWAAMKNRVPQAAAWDDPTVSFMSKAARFVEMPPNAMMNQTLSLEQMIPISGKNRVGARIATAEALLAFEEARREQLDVVTKVRTSFLRLSNGYAQLGLNEKNIASLRQIAEIARAEYEAGQQSVADVLVAETEASKLQETGKDLERQISDEKSALNVLMNRDAFSHLGRPRIEKIPPVKMPLVQLRNLMLVNRPELRMAQAQIEAEREKVQLARREWIPDPSISVQVQRYNATEKAISEFDTGIAISIPWGNAGKYAAQTREANSSLAAAAAGSRARAMKPRRCCVIKCRKLRRYAIMSNSSGTPLCRRRSRPLRPPNQPTRPARAGLRNGLRRDARCATFRPRSLFIRPITKSPSRSWKELSARIFLDAPKQTEIKAK
jgi:hypothetical protein